MDNDNILALAFGFTIVKTNSRQNEQTYRSFDRDRGQWQVHVRLECKLVLSNLIRLKRRDYNCVLASYGRNKKTTWMGLVTDSLDQTNGEYVV